MCESDSAGQAGPPRRAAGCQEWLQGPSGTSLQHLTSSLAVVLGLDLHLTAGRKWCNDERKRRRKTRDAGLATRTNTAGRKKASL